MSRNSRVQHRSSSGDLVLTGLSRRHPNHWISAGLILGHTVIYSIRTPDGYQAVQQDLTDFLEHEAKPTGLFRFREDCVLIKRPQLQNSVVSNVIVRPSWWRRLFLNEKPYFKKDNHVNVSQVIQEHLDIDDLASVEQIADFYRLV